jgi:diacylglycerol kinase family enzyme
VLALGARLDDPRFIVCLFQGDRRRDMVRYVAALALGRLARLADVTFVQATRVEIAAPAGEPVQADGELLARLPAVFTIEMNGLRLVVPR